MMAPGAGEWKGPPENPWGLGYMYELLLGDQRTSWDIRQSPSDKNILEDSWRGPHRFVAHSRTRSGRAVCSQKCEWTWTLVQQKWKNGFFLLYNHVSTYRYTFCKRVGTIYLTKMVIWNTLKFLGGSFQRIHILHRTSLSKRKTRTNVQRLKYV